MQNDPTPYSRLLPPEVRPKPLDSPSPTPRARRRFARRLFPRRDLGREPGRAGDSAVGTAHRGRDQPGGVGAGVVIACDGLVLTNSHMVGGAARVRLSFTDSHSREVRALGDQEPS